MHIITVSIKPLGVKAYGSIAHLPGSRVGPADHRLNDSQGAILTAKTRDKHDVVIVQEKLDGSCVSVANIDGAITPLIRAGYLAAESDYEQHHFFAEWVMVNATQFQFLQKGERVCGEWLAQAHGTRYDLSFRQPFAAFDIFRNGKRVCYDELRERARHTLSLAPLLHIGGALPISDALQLLTEHGHYGAIDEAEGAVWRVERHGVVDFLGKYVRPEKIDGKYFPEIGERLTWNWLPPALAEQSR